MKAIFYEKEVVKKRGLVVVMAHLPLWGTGVVL